MNVENTKAQMRKGMLEYCIMLLLRNRSCYANDIISQLKDADMIVVEGDVISIKNWDVYQNADELEKIRENQRKRTRKFREKQKRSNVTETFCNTEDKIREEKNKNIKERTQENESGFKN